MSDNLSQGLQENETTHVAQQKQWNLGFENFSLLLLGYIKSDGSRMLLKIDRSLNSAK